MLIFFFKFHRYSNNVAKDVLLIERQWRPVMIQAVYLQSYMIHQHLWHLRIKKEELLAINTLLENVRFELFQLLCTSSFLKFLYLIIFLHTEFYRTFCLCKLLICVSPVDRKFVGCVPGSKVGNYCCNEKKKMLNFVESRRMQHG